MLFSLGWLALYDFECDQRGVFFLHNSILRVDKGVDKEVDQGFHFAVSALPESSLSKTKRMTTMWLDSSLDTRCLKMNE